MKKISLSLFLFITLVTYSQKKGSISVKKTGGIDFFRIGEFADSIITKNISDIFYCYLTSDSVEIKLHNATLLKTSNEKEFKLTSTPGMRYRMIYVCDNADKLGTIERTYEAKISPDGVSNNNTNNVLIEIWNTKADTLIRKMHFVYKEN